MTGSISAFKNLMTHDESGMLGAIETLPQQLRDGLSAVRDVTDDIAATWPHGDGNPTPRTLIVCGMGGSGVGADLIAATAAIDAPVIAVKGYDIPEWASDQDRVICVSYSGDTSETLSAFNQARERSVVAAVITSGGELAMRAGASDIPIVRVAGGMQPRAAVGVLFGALAGAAASVGVVKDVESLIDAAVEGVERVIDENTGAGPEHGGVEPPALAFARELMDRVVIIYASGAAGAVAHRWKAQINENSKVPAFANVYPELCHNEIVGWEYARATGARWAVVELCELGLDGELRARFDITRDLISDDIEAVLRFQPQSMNAAAAAFELMVWGDYISVYMALLRAIDPSPVERIQSLKKQLAAL